MNIGEVAEIIENIAEGFEDACLNCLRENADTVYICITEQLFAGLDGNGDYLEPSYDNDDFFDEPGFWYHRSDDYKNWKLAITPPHPSWELGLDSRPESIPNLFIDGTFYSEIRVADCADGLTIDPGSGNGPAIIEKYGEQILWLGNRAVDYFNQEKMLPAIAKFFSDCGYR